MHTQAVEQVKKDAADAEADAIKAAEEEVYV